MPVSLRLLQATPLWRTVAELSRRADSGVAASARDVDTAWRALAEAAMRHVQHVRNQQQL
eukprot:364369-Chlamydomonas_euryale.AAC.16